MLHNLISIDIFRYIRIPAECLLKMQPVCTHINKPINCGIDMLEIWLCRILWTTATFQCSFRVENFNKHFAWTPTFISVCKSSHAPALCGTHTCSYSLYACTHVHTCACTHTHKLLACSTAALLQGYKENTLSGTPEFCFWHVDYWASYEMTAR